MFLAIKELKHSKLKFSLLTTIIFLVTFLVLFITGLANGLANEGKSAISTTDIQSFVLQKNSNNRISRSNLTNDDIKKINNDNLVPLTINQRTIQKNGDKNNKVDISFFTIDFDSFLKPEINKGNNITNSTKKQVVVSQKLADDGYKIGDDIIDTNTKSKFEIAGFTDDKSYSHTPVVYLNSTEGESISQQPGTINTLVSKKNINDVKGYTVVDKATIIQNIPGYSEEQGSLLMMISFLYAISIVVLGVFFYIITLEKTPQLGTLKAIGASTRYLANNLLSQVVVITGLSLIISNIFILGMKMILPASMPFSLDLPILLLTDSLFIIIAVVSTIISLIKISKVDPVSAIGGN
ncbi:ABC transporter permease [Companilactobacillus sp. RD055328]|uniref:ABC transporter permease n=1 Tax=Companilactobacillus sp. RD055328 TaxID=2916634 RepID=UPI001FC86127|nr:ABC transporter permease [Companilactobacillus sp. RD055328]GKQ43199.1 ABC transporter permease [Companilactobacillus sp. RD055328]